VNGSSKTQHEPRISDRIGIYVVAANRLLREALGRILKRAGFEAIGSTEDWRADLDELGKLRPAVLLINGGATQFDWASFIAEARVVLPDTPLVLFGAQENADAFFRAVCAGVVAYVSSESPASDLVAAIRSALRDDAFCPPRLCRELFRYVARQAHKTDSTSEKYSLTRRERQLVPLISEGLTNKEIAARLILSELTVKNHVGRLLRKTGTRNRLSAAQAAEASEERL
jgi:DNA-binding NarL/FixJ family response regulator